MKSLKSLIEKKRHVQSNSIEERDLFQVFREVIDEEYGKTGLEKYKADFFKDGKIFVKCTSSAWASELYMKERKIVELINEKLGSERIEKIKIK